MLLNLGSTRGPYIEVGQAVIVRNPMDGEVNVELFHVLTQDRLGRSRHLIGLREYSCPDCKSLESTGLRLWFGLPSMV